MKSKDNGDDEGGDDDGEEECDKYCAEGVRLCRVHIIYSWRLFTLRLRDL